MKLLLSLLLVISSKLIANELEWVDEQIDAIKPPRNGINKSKINTIKSPFIYKAIKEKEKVASLVNKDTNIITKKEINLSLNAIMNESAFINEKWYKINDKIGKYTITSINRERVILIYKKKTLLLSIKTKNNSIKFKNN